MLRQGRGAKTQATMETIERKSLLYKSGLGFWCANHVLGCSHGCKYPCYACMMAKTYGRAKDYAEWCRPKLVANAAELLDAELKRKRKKPESINLCLTTDPFMTGYPEVSAMSLKLIEVANGHGVACSTLTKGLYPMELADRERFPADNLHGISLISLDEGFRLRWEPGASSCAGRMSALRALHENSGWNYNSLATGFPGRREFYESQAEIAKRFCAGRDIEFQ